MGLFRNSGELEIGTSNLRQNPRQVQQTKERNVILWRRRKSEGVVLNKSPLEKKQEFRMMTGSHWLRCRGNCYLVGDAVLGPGIEVLSC